MRYHHIPKEKVLEIYKFVINKRKEGFGQRKLTQFVKERFNLDFSENTISNWIFYHKIPFANEITQFKSLQKPKKEQLYNYYIKEKLSAQKIAEIYKASTVTIIHWLKEYKIKTRSHLESMNTPNLKEELKNKKLRIPKKEFHIMSPEKAYILGVLCGDAYITDKVIRFEIRKDKEFIKKFTECIKKVYGLNYNYYYYKKRNSFILYVSSQKICEDLLSYGKFKTFRWRVPKQIMESDNELILAGFLNGFYDSEGFVGNGAIGLTSVNINGIKDVSFLLKKIGIDNKIYAIKDGRYYNIYILRKERFKIFRNKIGFTIQRKQNKLNRILKNDRAYKPA